MGGRRAARLYLIALTLALAAVGAQSTRGGGLSWPNSPSPRVEYALRLASAAYGVPLSDLRAVAFCESRWHPRADGMSGAGLFQFTARTWQRTPYRAFSPLDPIANALAAAWLVRRDGSWREWTCKP